MDEATKKRLGAEIAALLPKHTKYKDEVEKKAELLAASTVTTLGQLVLPERNRY